MAGEDNSLLWRIGKWFPDIEPSLQNKLKQYHEQLIHFNGRINLISNRTEKTADLTHFADCIMGSRVIMSNTTRKEVFDFGTGNGLPGFVMAILYPATKFILVDADARKIEFLKHCGAKLDLKNISFHHARVEDLTLESAHCAVTRGFASVSKVLLLARKVAAPDCEVFHFKGDTWPREVAEIPSQILAHWAPAFIGDYSLPEGGHKLSIVKTKRK